MTKRQRVRAALTRNAVDRVPYSLWYHFRLDPPAGERMAQAELDFYERFDPDLFKVMHDISYEMPHDMPQVDTPDEWARLPVLDGVSGHFGQQLQTIRMILERRRDDGPVLDTVFGPFATAEKVSGKRTIAMLRADPDRVHRGLRALASSLSNYARALVEAGADGIYLAIAGAASDTMPASEYREHFAAYDQQVLDAARGASVNVVHHHGVGIYPDLALGLQGYHVYSWSNRLAGNPGIREIRLRTQTCLMCGVNEAEFGVMSAQSIIEEAREAIADTRGTGFILAPGCAVPSPPDSPDANLRTFAKAVGG